MAGITLYMQPVQDLTIDATVSRTQYQFVLQDANPDELDPMDAEAGRAADALPQLADVASDLSDARACRLRRHRPRHGRAVRHHAGDDRQRALRRLRPAHRLDHLHPIQPVPRHPRGGPVAAGIRCDRSVLDLPAVIERRRPGAAVGDRQRPAAHGAAADQPSRPVPRDHDLVQPGAGRLARRGGRPRSSRRRARSACRPASSPVSRARRWRSRRRSATSCC